MEEKSNNDKAKSEAENEYPGGWFLNRLPDACADCVLGYLDKKSLCRLLLAQTQKDPVTEESHYDKIKNLPVYKQHKRRFEYPKYFMWYVYGFGNAERLCKIVDDVLNKHKNEIGNDENKRFLLRHMILLDILNIKMSDLKLDFEKEKSESVGEAIKNCLLSNKMDTKMMADHPERLLLCKIVDDVLNKHKNEIGNDENKKFLLRHMILLDILNIKMSDLELDFDKENSKSVEEAIKNRLLSNKMDTKMMADHPERLLWEYSRQVFPEFKDLPVKPSDYETIYTDVNTGRLLGRIFACFLKVSFYQMKRVENSSTGEDSQKNCKEYKKKIYKFNYYLYGKIFDKLNPKVEITSSIAAYLFETEELETWFRNYNKDFFSFFCNPDHFLFGDDGESHVEFFDFAFYLNKIKSFETRYRENPDEFWQTFYINIVKKKSYRGNSVIADITSFISQTELQNRMRPKIDAFEGYGGFRHHHYDLFNHKKLDTIDLEKKYFSPIIIRFCGQKNLTDEAIQSISKVIEDKGVLNNNLAISNQIDLISKDKISDPNNKLNGKNKIGFWQHFFIWFVFCPHMFQFVFMF